MGQQRTPFSIAAPGFKGLNLQDSPVGLEPTFALVANNCVIDKSGRIAARMGYDRLHSANADLSTSNITCIGEVTENSGTTTTVAAGGGFLFKHAGSTLTTLTYGGGGVAPTISASNWQFCQMNGIGIFWQRGYDPLIYDPAISTTTFRRLNEKTGTAGTIQQCNTAISAYGRVWAADLTADKNTLYWSDVLAPHVWTGGSSGSLNLLGVWPRGGDEIIGLAAHNNFLIIFGKRQTLIYQGATTPSTMSLYDSLPTIGCIARDSIQNTGDDVLFLSDTGVRALMRTIQEKSAPLREISANVRDNLQADIASETLANVKSVYAPTQAFYLLTMPANDKTYCFDLRVILPNGAARATTWALEPKSLYYTSTRLLYMGFAGYLTNYAGYLDHTSTYIFFYYTPWIDFGNPIQTSILKDIVLTMIGAGSQTITFKWAYDFVESYFSATATITGNTVSRYGTATYGNSVYGAATSVNVASVNGSSSGQVLQVGFEIVINDSAFSMQKIDIFTKEGRI